MKTEYLAFFTGADGLRWHLAAKASGEEILALEEQLQAADAYGLLFDGEDEARSHARKTWPKSFAAMPLMVRPDVPGDETWATSDTPAKPAPRAKRRGVRFVMPYSTSSRDGDFWRAMIDGTWATIPKAAGTYSKLVALITEARAANAKARRTKARRASA